jgi:hypothetical protein
MSPALCDLGRMQRWDLLTPWSGQSFDAYQNLPLSSGIVRCPRISLEFTRYKEESIDKHATLCTGRPLKWSNE